jgi:hypothetical protein
MAKPRIGGTFAPPLTPEKMDRYAQLASVAPEMVRLEMTKLLDMVRAFSDGPTRGTAGERHPSGAGTIVPLADAEIKRLWDLVPWNDEKPGDHVNECRVLAELFDGISPVKQKELRDAAFHLLWYANELALDREPITADRL